MRACLGISQCVAITSWGVSDAVRPCFASLVRKETDNRMTGLELMAIQLNTIALGQQLQAQVCLQLAHLCSLIGWMNLFHVPRSNSNVVQRALLTVLWYSQLELNMRFRLVRCCDSV